MSPVLAILEAGYTVLGLIFTMVIVGALIVSISSMKSRDTNFKCGLATTILFLTLLVENAVLMLELSGGGTPVGISRTLVFSAGMHVAALLVAVWGLREMRIQRKWMYGRQRAIWGICLNLGMLLVLAVWWYLRTHPKFLDSLLN